MSKQGFRFQGHCASSRLLSQTIFSSIQQCFFHLQPPPIHEYKCAHIQGSTQVQKACNNHECVSANTTQSLHYELCFYLCCQLLGVSRFKSN